MYHLSHRNTGLVTAIAFESLVKLGAMLILFLAAVYAVFGGIAGLEQWLLENPQMSNQLAQPIQGDDAPRPAADIFRGRSVYAPHLSYGFCRKQRQPRACALPLGGFRSICCY